MANEESLASSLPQEAGTPSSRPQGHRAPPQRLYRPTPARADLRGHGVEVRAAGGAGLVQVEAAVHLHHHGGHARVLPVAAGGHQGAGKRAVQLHAPAIRREGLHEGAGGSFTGVEGVGAYADVRANVRAGPAFVGQRTGRKAVAVQSLLR